MSLNDFLKTSDIYLTLTNDQGEVFAAGKADYVKPLNSKTVIKWHVDGEYANTFPFTYAILHGLRSIFELVAIKPIQPGKETTVEMVYS